jgi:predicted RNA-binding protein YlxR (DUF448 family)
MIRIVRDPEGGACFDLEGRLPGRGAWVCPSPACVDALAAGALAHVLRAPVRLAPPEQRRRQLADALGRRVANLLTIARRMRGLATGPSGARAAVASGRARLLLLAADAPQATAAPWARRAPQVPCERAPGAAALGELLGRAPVSVAAVTVEGLAAPIAQALTRWRAFAGISCDNDLLQPTIRRAPGREPAPPRGEAEGR